MNHPLVYLLTRSLWNGALFRLRRLRQPKYLFGAIVGGFYLFFVFGRVLFLPSGPRSGHPGPFPNPTFGPPYLALLLLVVTLMFAWIFPGSRAALFFTEAEIAWLFPAPLSRSALIHYKLIASQLGLVAFSLLFAFIRGRVFQPAGFRLVLGWWIILFTFRLHRLGASFALQRLREFGLADRKRRVVFVCGILAVAAAIYFTGRTAAAAGALKTEIIQLPHLLQTPVAHWLLLPFSLVVAPCFATTTHEFLAALGPASIIMILHYVWVVRADVSFEEASIAFSQKYAAILARRRSGEISLRKPPKNGRDPVFALRPTGPLAIAFFWKALLQFGGRQGFRTTLIVIVGVFVAVKFVITAFPAAFAGIFALTFGVLVFMIIMIPNQAALQFRRSIQMMDLLKTYPIRGWHVATGELIASLCNGLAWQWSLILFLLVNLHSYVEMLKIEVSPSILAPCLLSAAAIFPGFNLVTAFLPSASILMFPAWFKSGKQEIEAAGMRLLLGIGQLIALTAALVPAAGVAVLAWWLLSSTLNPFHLFIVAALIAAAVLLIEGLLGLFVLGRLFDEFDVIEEES